MIYLVWTLHLKRFDCHASPSCEIMRPPSHHGCWRLSCELLESQMAPLLSYSDGVVKMTGQTTQQFSTSSQHIIAEPELWQLSTALGCREYVNNSMTKSSLVWQRMISMCSRPVQKIKIRWSLRVIFSLWNYTTSFIELFARKCRWLCLVLENKEGWMIPTCAEK